MTLDPIYVAFCAGLIVGYLMTTFVVLMAESYQEDSK